MILFTLIASPPDKILASVKKKLHSEHSCKLPCESTHTFELNICYVDQQMLLFSTVQQLWVTCYYCHCILYRQLIQHVT